MDDDCGYPYVRKPPSILLRNWLWFDPVLEGCSVQATSQAFQHVFFGAEVFWIFSNSNSWWILMNSWSMCLKSWLFTKPNVSLATCPTGCLPSRRADCCGQTCGYIHVLSEYEFCRIYIYILFIYILYYVYIYIYVYKHICLFICLFLELLFLLLLSLSLMVHRQ